eukprot:TRINITY_DN3334_c0_g1_i2.p1 TRINITY_DN3334_c0_g1~~TRINITY_DN3334_c0_g1_i2.p1  ORF type:complete len:127 (-),score=5.53 TRINITY_DN3334_c0_g1_i2:486-866(-)
MFLAAPTLELLSVQGDVLAYAELPGFVYLKPGAFSARNQAVACGGRLAILRAASGGLMLPTPEVPETQEPFDRSEGAHRPHASQEIAASCCCMTVSCIWSKRSKLIHQLMSGRRLGTPCTVLAANC